MVIGRLALNRLCLFLDLKAEKVHVDCHNQHVVLPTVSGYTHFHEFGNETDSEDFNTNIDASNPVSSEEADENVEEEDLVIMIQVKQRGDEDEERLTNKDCKRMIRQDLLSKMDHLQEEEASQIADMIVDASVVARSLAELGPANVHANHSIDLNDDKPIHHCRRREAPKHIKIVKDETNGS